MHELLKIDRQIEVEGIYSFLYHEHSNKFVFNGERHNFWELAYVDSGEVVEFSDNTRCVLSQGDVIFHKPMEFHAMASINDKPHNVMVITFECKSPIMTFFENKHFTVGKEQKKLLSLILKQFEGIFGTKYNSEFDKGFVLTTEQSKDYQIGLSHLEHFLLDLIGEEANIKQKNAPQNKNINDAFIDSIEDYLTQKVYATLTLDEICAHFNMSKSYLCQFFKNETGHSIIDYYIDLKMKEAKFLIRQGELNYTQIADRLGYSSIHHFTRMFKSRVKMSPSGYEKAIK